MGHEIRYVSFPESTSREEIARECNDIAIRCGEYHSPLNSPIRFQSVAPLLNKRKAEDYIRNIDKDFYGAYAVRYLEYPDSVTNKKLEDINKRLFEAKKKYALLSCEFHFKDVKSAFIGCKECGSKLSVAHLLTNKCPLCGHDLRPETKLNQIAALDAKVKKLEAQSKAEFERLQEKAKANAQVMWLVKFEYNI